MDDHSEAGASFSAPAVAGIESRLPSDRASLSANAGYEVTMLVISMVVPLVLGSTAIGCGLEVRARRVAPCLYDARRIGAMSPMSSLGRAAF